MAGLSLCYIEKTGFCDYSLDGFRLPTEAEWEYACRAGNTTDYNIGFDENDLALAGWYRWNSGEVTRPVGLKKPNAWGLYDMHGNVLEWCADWYGDYLNHASTNPTGPVSGKFRVYRGGSWNRTAKDCRSASRFRRDPSRPDNEIGFRIVRRIST
jgi:formylglycine-generating enzyme required for sulfatase activity